MSRIIRAYDLSSKMKHLKYSVVSEWQCNHPPTHIMSLSSKNGTKHAKDRGVTLSIGNERHRIDPENVVLTLFRLLLSYNALIHYTEWTLKDGICRIWAINRSKHAIVCFIRINIEKCSRQQLFWVDLVAICKMSTAVLRSGKLSQGITSRGSTDKLFSGFYQKLWAISI